MPDPFSKNPFGTSITSKPKPKTQEEIEAEKEISEEELESFISPETDASYFERAQDFKHLIKTLRIKYLGLRPKQKINPDGSTVTVFVKDPTKVPGITEEGIEATIRFLEPRLGKHVVLSDWTEERMMQVMYDDMVTWYEMMVQKLEDYKLSYDIFNELRILINDELEYAYRRAIENKERDGMRPVSREILKAFGLGGKDEGELQDQRYPISELDRRPGTQRPEY